MGKYLTSVVGTNTELGRHCIPIDNGTGTLVCIHMDVEGEFDYLGWLERVRRELGVAIICA